MPMKKVMRFGAVTDSPNPGSFVAAARGRATGHTPAANRENGRANEDAARREAIQELRK